MKSIILTHSLYRDQEVIYPYYRLQEEGEVILVAEKTGMISGLMGTQIEAKVTTSNLAHQAEKLFNFDLLVLPGGVRAMEKLRQDEDALGFINLWNQRDKPIACICSGAQMLLSARIPLQRRYLAAYPAMKVDVENAGAIFSTASVAICGNLVSSPHYNHLAKWMQTTINLVRSKTERCWKCGRIFPTSGSWECTESPCGAIVSEDRYLKEYVKP